MVGFPVLVKACNMWKRTQIYVLLCLCALLLNACTTGQSKKAITQTPQTVRAVVPEALQNNDNTLTVTPLGDSNLPNGTCGMVLWTVDADRPVPVLRYVAGDVGEIHLSRIPHEIIRTDLAGNGAFGIFPEQKFVAGTDISIEVDLEFGQGFDGGSYIKKGIVSIERPDSPTLIVPVAGIAGCRGR